MFLFLHCLQLDVNNNNCFVCYSSVTTLCINSNNIFIFLFTSLCYYLLLYFCLLVYNFYAGVCCYIFVYLFSISLCWCLLLHFCLLVYHFFMLVFVVISLFTCLQFFMLVFVVTFLFTCLPFFMLVFVVIILCKILKNIWNCF